jgi:hypothetical protein
MNARNTRRPPVKPLLALLLATGLAACAPQVSVKSGPTDAATGRHTYERIMVVGVSPDVNQRCAFERFMVSQLATEKTVVFASCNAVKTKDPLTRESLEEAVAAQKPDAVLATILVSRDYGLKEGHGRDDRGDASYKATDYGWASGYYGIYGVPVVYGEFRTLPSITTLQGEVHVSSRLFETSGATVVYTLDTVAKNLESREEALARIATPIAERLRRDGLTR